MRGSLGTPTLDFNSRTTSRRFGTTWATVKKPLTQEIKLAGLSPRQDREAPRRQRGLPGTVGPPHRPRPMGGPLVGGSKVVGSRGHPTQQPSPRRSILSKRWVALATLLLVANCHNSVRNGYIFGVSVVWLKQIEQTRSDYRLRDNADSPRPL